MNNGKLLLASAFVTTTLLIGIPVLKNNFESKYSVLEEKAVSNSAVKAQGAAARCWPCGERGIDFEPSASGRGRCQ